MFQRLAVVGIALAAIVAMTATSTVAGTVFYEDFDSYPSTLTHEQGGWKGWDNSLAAAGYLSTAYSLSPSYSVEVVADVDLVHEFAVVGGQWIFTAMMYVPSSSTGTVDSYFILLNNYEDGGANTVDRWSVQSYADLDNGKYISDFGNGAATTLVKDRWVELKCVIDLDANHVDEYYDGSLLASYPWYDAADAQGHAHGAIEAVDLYGGNGATSVFYDNIQLQTLPTAVPGDANDDGKVDDLDASILAANWQRMGDATWATADFNDDKNVNDLDASILAANWQYGVGAAVPEPAGWALLVGLAVVSLARRVRRRGF